MEASLPYIDRITCKKLYERNIEFKDFLTLDKFCAGSKSGNKIVYIISKNILVYFIIFNKNKDNANILYEMSLNLCTS